MAAKTKKGEAPQPEAAKYIAVRAFRSEAAAASGKRGRRLVIDQESGTVQSLGSRWNPETRETTYEGMQAVAGIVAADVPSLAMALSASKTPLVVEDPALSAYVNVHDGQLPLEGLTGVGPDDFVDQREAAVARRNRIAERTAEQSEEAAA